MISVYQFKTSFQDFLRPICSRLALRGVTANQVTLSAIVLSVMYGALLCMNLNIFWLFLPLILFLRMGLNAIDGMLAREHGMKSKLGMALNELGDVISDTAIFLPFMFVAPNASWAIGLFIFSAVLSEMCGLTAYMMSGERRYDGPMGKSDRAVAIGIIGFLIGLGYLGPYWIASIFVMLFVLTCWSCCNRIFGAINAEKD